MAGMERAGRVGALREMGCVPHNLIFQTHMRRGRPYDTHVYDADSCSPVKWNRQECLDNRSPVTNSVVASGARVCVCMKILKNYFLNVKELNKKINNKNSEMYMSYG